MTGGGGTARAGGSGLTLPSPLPGHHWAAGLCVPVLGLLPARPSWGQHSSMSGGRPTCLGTAPEVPRVWIWDRHRGLDDSTVATKTQTPQEGNERWAWGLPWPFCGAELGWGPSTSPGLRVAKRSRQPSSPAAGKCP